MVDSSSTRHLHIEFKNVAVENKAKSRIEGRPIFEQQEQVHIRFVGDTKKELVAPAHEKCARDPGNGQWISYAQLYHKHYDAFKSGQEVAGDGTPVEELHFIDAAKRAELKALHVHTAEALAGLEGNNLTRLGMYGRELKEKAKAYIEKAKDSALETRLAAENAQLKARLEALEAQVGRSTPGEQTAPTEFEAEAPAGTVFESWDDPTLKAFIKERGGTVPKGNSSHASLVRQAQELFSGEQEAA
jgi:hypothetical protein